MAAGGDFLTRVLSNYNQFTKAERKVADFIMQHSQEVLFMSITDLADACKVGETTVFRFCKTMHTQGYQELKIQLSLSMKEEPEIKKGEQGENGGGLGSFMPGLLESNYNVLRETDSLLSRKMLDEILEHMTAARKIVFMGVGSSGMVAMLAANKFLRITDKVQCFADSHMQAMNASLLKPEDVAMVISYSGSTKDSIAVARLAKEAGAYVVAISRFIKSPLMDYADAALLCGSKEGPLQGSSITAIISQLYIMEVLYSGYYSRNYDESYMNNKKSAESVTEKMI